MSVQVQLRRDTYANIFAATSAPAAGEIWIDTTTHRPHVGDGSTLQGFPSPVTLFVGSGGSTNNSNSGSGAFVNHTPTFTIPANFMISGRAFRVTAHLTAVTGAGPPVLYHRLSLGGVVLGQSGSLGAGTASVTLQMGIQWFFQATQAPSGASNVQCSMVTGPFGSVNENADSFTAQPVAVATNAAQAVTIATEWATAGTGVNTVTLNQLIIEALN